MVGVLPALVVCLTTASAWVVAPPTHSLARTRGAELTRVAAKKAAAEKDSRLWEGDVRRTRTRPHHRAARSARLPHLRLSPPPRPAPQWVCADCGYVYDKQLFGGKYFEEQGYGFKCPQCSGPRRRYAKMVGNTVGVTLDGGDGPILLFSGVGFAITIAFAVWVSLARRRLEFAIVAR